MTESRILVMILLTCSVVCAQQSNLRTHLGFPSHNEILTVVGLASNAMNLYEMASVQDLSH